jgi:hypothetical protein
MGFLQTASHRISLEIVVICFWSNFCDIDYDNDRAAAFTAIGRKTVSSWCK